MTVDEAQNIGDKAQGILFLCTGNSTARSQMAEGMARRLAAGRIEVYSAGVEPKGVHPMAIEAMDEVGVDIRGQFSKEISDVPGYCVGIVVTLCDDAAQSCPGFAGELRRHHWSLPDSSGCR